MKSSSLSGYFVKGELFKRFSGLAATGVGLVTSYFVIKSLSVFHYGLYQLVLSFVGILTSLNLEFLDGAILVEMRHYLNSKKNGFAKKIFFENAFFKLAFGLVISIAVFLGSDLVSNFYGSDVGLFVKITSILFIVDILQSIERILLKSVFSFAHWNFPAVKEISKLIIILAFLNFGGLNILRIIVAHTAAELMSLLFVTFFVFLKNYRSVFAGVAPAPDFLVAGVFKKFGGWGLARYGLSMVTKNSTPWFVKVFVNTEAVGYYSLAMNLISFVGELMPSAGFSPVFLKKIGNLGGLSFVFKRSLKYLFWLGVIFAIGGFLVVPPLVIWLFPAYVNSLKIFRTMTLALPLYAVYDIFKQVTTILREYKILTLRILNEAILIPLGLIVFLPTIGVLGTGLVYIAIYLERVWYFYTRLSRKYPEFKIKTKDFFRFDASDKYILARLKEKLFPGFNFLNK